MHLPKRHRRRMLAALLTGVVMAGLTLTGSVVPAQAANGTLSGTVTEAGSGAPLQGVTVEAFCWQVSGSEPGEACGTTQPAADGTYAVHVPDGTYRVGFSDAHGPHQTQY